MYVHVVPGAVTVEDVENLRQLHVELDGVDDPAAATAVADAGLGTLEADHAWLTIAGLRAAGEQTEPWLTNFDAMIDYATSKGWVTGDRVRAHIVRP